MKKILFLLIAALLLSSQAIYAYWSDKLEVSLKAPVVYEMTIRVNEAAASPGIGQAPSSNEETSEVIAPSGEGEQAAEETGQGAPQDAQGEQEGANETSTEVGD